VAHDVALVEEHEPDPLDVGEELLRLAQSGGLPLRQIHLRDVAGDDRARAESDAGQEHLHLLGGRVLRLVEDDERVVQRAAAHEGDRRDLDDSALEELGGLLVPQDVVERVVERPQVRIDLLDHVARKEAQPLPRLDRGPGQHDPLDLLLQERRGRHGHGEVSLAGAGRPDREDQVVPVDRLDVEPLFDVAGGDDGFQRRAERALHEELHERRAGVLLENPDPGRDVACLERVAHREQLREIREQPAGGLLPLAFAPDRDLVAPGGQADAEGLFDGAEVFVGDSEKRGHPRVGKGDGERGLRNLGRSLRGKPDPLAFA
jgi:hypothetical protein